MLIVIARILNAQAKMLAGRRAHRLAGTGNRARRRVAAVIAIVGGLALPLAAAGPASADQVRSREQWVLDALNVPSAWRISQGRGVTVAVIDSGVDPDTSDLVGSVTTGPDLTGVDTPMTNPGWGLHGTWMASLIVGHGHGSGDQDGIIGVAPQARVLSIRVITDRADPGYATYQAEPTSRGQRELATAIRYAVLHRAGVISMSLGYEAPSLIVRAALQYALNHNVVVVASAGNSGTAETAVGRGRAPYSFPADYLGVLGVAAVGQSGLSAYFSSANLSVQVAAPGVNVPAQGRDGRYWLVSGTSPACALTAGVAALIKSKYPRLTAAQIRRSITSSAQRRPVDGYDPEVGFGTVDATAALAAAQRLSRQRPAGNSASAAGNFGGGPAAAPAVPVAPRGRDRLFALFALAAGCVLVLAFSLRRIAAPPPSRGAAVGGSAGAAPPGSEPGPASGLVSGFEGTAVDLRYPAQGYPGQPPQPGQPQAGQLQPGQQYPGQSEPGQGYPPQSHPGQPQPVWQNPPPGYLSQQDPGQQSASQSYPSQPQQGPQYPPPSYLGQQSPVQGRPPEREPGQPQPPWGHLGQSQPGPADPLQRQPGQPQPDSQGQPKPGSQTQPGQPKPGSQTQPGQPKPGRQAQPGQTQPAGGPGDRGQDPDSDEPPTQPQPEWDLWTPRPRTVPSAGPDPQGDAS